MRFGSPIVPALLVLLPSCGGELESEPPYPTSGCPPSHELVDGRCTVRQVLIPGGEFTLGAGLCQSPGILDMPPEFRDCPLADAPRVVTVKPFWVDVTPLAAVEIVDSQQCRNGDLACVGRNYEPANLPFIGHSFELDYAVGQFEKFCAKRGKRWLTEVEWEYLATGGGTRSYPWGNRAPRCSDANFDTEQCDARNAADGGVSLIASYPPSPEGVYDLFGGYWEMLAPAPEAYDATYTPLPLSLPPCQDPCTWLTAAPVTALRGASTKTPLEEVRADYRFTTHSGDSGFFKFRCARDAESG